MRLLFLVTLILFSPLENALANEEQSNLFDNFHQYFSSRIKNVSSGFDSLFGDQEFEDSHGSTITFEQYFTSIEQKSMLKETRFKARWVFPNMKKNLKFVLRQTPRINEQDQRSQESDLITRVDNNRENIAAGLNYDFVKDSINMFSLESGILLRDPIDPYVRSRFRFKKFFDWTNLFITQQVFLYKVDGFGANLRVDLKSRIHDNKTYVYGNYFYWLDNTDRVEFFTGPSLQHKISNRRQISYNWKMSFVNKPIEILESHLLFINYRQLIHKNWFYIELIPSIEFPREQDWKDIFSITIKFQAIFGDVR